MLSLALGLRRAATVPMPSLRPRLLLLPALITTTRTYAAGAGHPPPSSSSSLAVTPSPATQSLMESVVSDAAKTESKRAMAAFDSGTLEDALAGRTPRRSKTFRTPNMRASVWKVNLVAKVIRGLELHEAMKQMEFNKKRAASKILSTLRRIRSHLEHNWPQEDLTTDGWIIKQAYVGKGTVLKRVHIKGRGRNGRMQHPSAHVVFKLEQLPAVIRNETPAQKTKRLELEKLIKAFKRRKLYVQLQDTRRITEYHPPWSSKPYKYITSPKWISPDNALARRR